MPKQPNNSAVDDTLASISGRQAFLLSGEELVGHLSDALADGTIARTITGAPTLTWQINDATKQILGSGIFGGRVTMSCGPYTYEFVSVDKQGTQLTITGEDQAVAALRRNTDPLKVTKGVMTHVDFAKKLVTEVPWLKFKTVDVMSKYKVVTSKEDFTRGTPNGNSTGDGPSSSWDELQNNAAARGWRCFIRGVDTVWYVPDEFLFEDDPNYVITEGEGGVDNIDFEYDKGQRVATVTVTCEASPGAGPVGTVAWIKNIGPANGKYLVQDVSRSPLQKTATITMIKPQPILPEPTSGVGATGAGTAGSSAAAIAADHSLSSNPATRVAQYAIRAGFPSLYIVTAIAISFAEDTTHDPNLDSAPNIDGSIDRGLWQINNMAHPEYSDTYCHNGQNNATAAFKISHGGTYFYPWTTYRTRAYEKYLGAALRAYNDAVAFANSRKGIAPPITDSKRAIDFVAEALSQRHKAYVYGAQTSPANANPKSFDCSLLVEWAAGRVGISLPRTAQEQFLVCRSKGTLISVEHAARVRGAVLYEGSAPYTGTVGHGIGDTGSNSDSIFHTAISLGNGETIEARGRAYGVNEFGISGRGFSYAGLIPGMRY